MRHRPTLPPLPPGPASLTEQEMKDWRTRLEKYVGFTNHVADPTASGYASLDGWGYLADAYVSDYLNRWNEANKQNNNSGNGKELVKWATIALTNPNGSNSSVKARYAQALLYRAKGDYASALTQFQSLINDGLGFPRCYAQYANELINTVDPNDPLLDTAVNSVTAAINAAQVTIQAGGMELSLGTFYWILGRAQFFKGQYSSAIKSFQTSRDGDGSNPSRTWMRADLWYNQLYLVSAYELNQDHNDAVGAFRIFQNNFPNFPKGYLDYYENDLPNPKKTQLFRSGLSKFGF
jgi:tetratricopeptide (TPR) repeat protein